MDGNGREDRRATRQAFAAGGGPTLEAPAGEVGRVGRRADGGRGRPGGGRRPGPGGGPPGGEGGRARGGGGRVSEVRPAAGRGRPPSRRRRSSTSSSARRARRRSRSSRWSAS